MCPIYSSHILFSPSSTKTLPPALETSSWPICVDSIVIKLSSVSCWHWTLPTTARITPSKRLSKQSTHAGQTSVKWHHFTDLSYSHSLASPTAANNIPSPLWIRYMLTRRRYKNTTPIIHNLTTKTCLMSRVVQQFTRATKAECK